MKHESIKKNETQIRRVKKDFRSCLYAAASVRSNATLFQIARKVNYKSFKFSLNEVVGIYQSQPQ